MILYAIEKGEILSKNQLNFPSREILFNEIMFYKIMFYKLCFTNYVIQNLLFISNRMKTILFIYKLRFKNWEKFYLLKMPSSVTKKVISSLLNLT